MSELDFWGDPASLYQAVFENSRDAIGLSYAGTHVIVNPAYLKMFGYDSNQELQGRSILDLIAPSERDPILNYVRLRYNKENPPTFYETKGLRKDGREFDMEVTVSSYWKQEKHFTLVILRDISSQKQAAQRIADSEARFRILSESSPMGIFYQDSDGNCLYVNSKWQEITGLSFEEGVGLKWLESIHSDDRVGIWQEWESQIKANGLLKHELRFLHPDGTIRWVAVQASSITHRGGEILGYVGTLEDITHRKSFEEQIKASLQEREILLQEIHHRVKNNFQVMLSMLNLQMRKLNVPEAYDVLQTSHNRIRSMSLVHELLYESQSVAEIDLRKYLKELARELSSLYLNDLPVELRFELEPLSLSLEQAMPCGLLVTEVLTNSFKYGFRPPYAGQPQVSIHLNSEGKTLCLTLQDNGQGLPTNFDLDSSPGLGFRLIKALITQLNGRFNLNSESGVCWQIWFSPTQA